MFARKIGSTEPMLFPPPRDDQLLLSGKGEKLLSLALTYATPKQRAEWLRLPLVGAAAEGDLGLVKQLLAAGADASSGQIEPDGSTLLHAAAEGGSAKIMKALLDAGACPNVNQRRLFGDQEFPLHVAAKGAHVRMCEALIKAGAKVNCRDRNGWTPLHLAARFGQVEVVVDLLRDGADREAEDVNGYRPLHYATMWGHPATTRALLKAGAALESITRVDGTRPLHIAARYGSAVVVQELLSQGADKDAKTSRGFSPVHAAAASNKAEAISILIKAGSDINLSDGQLGFTPLHLAARRGAVQAASLLLEAGARVDARTRDGSTPLHLACTHLKLSAVRLLLRHDADETSLNGAGETPSSVVASFQAELDRDEELVNRIMKVLAEAPAERAWRRRGWLVMTRTRSQREEALRAFMVAPEVIGPAQGEEVRATNKLHRGDDDGAERARNTLAITGSSICPAPSSILEEAVDRVLGLDEEGVFQNIALFL